MVYKAIETDRDGQRSTRCIKIFGAEWMTPFNLECTAYAYLIHAKLDSLREGFIPKVYGWAKRTFIDWGVDPFGNLSDEETLHNGIVMEFLEGAEHFGRDNATINLGTNFVSGLTKIHEARVLHRDLFTRNMLVIPGSDRAVWVDFSCARIRGPPGSYEQTSELALAARIAIANVSAAPACRRLMKGFRSDAR